MAYSPEGDEMVAAPEGSPGWITGQLDRPVMVIPPNASLVIVRIETIPSLGDWAGPGTYVCPEDQTEWRYRATNFRLGYPGLGEALVHIGGDRFWFGEYQGVGYACPGSGWLYFIVAEIDVDPSLLWLEYVGGTELEELAFWTLSVRR